MSPRRSCRDIKPRFFPLKTHVLGEAAAVASRIGYRRLFVLLRLYREEGLTVRKRKARRKALGTRAPILIEARANAR